MTQVRVKICGVTSAEDVAVVAAAGAHAIGLNFHPASPRYVPPANAMELMRHWPAFVDAVGVFVGMKTRHICAIAYQLGLGGVQTFADDEFDDSFPFRRIAAFRVKDESSLKTIDDYVARCRAANALPAAILVDAHVEGQLGGTGKTAPWELLAGYSPGIPLILAGGLTPDNVADAIRLVRPYAVDVASGVEISPGKKDPARVRRFIEQARSVSG